jgi:catechol 2,3-dioxygenase-like lactoylglutathione lyase family enzyme
MTRVLNEAAPVAAFLRPKFLIDLGMKEGFGMLSAAKMQTLVLTSDTGRAEAFYSQVLGLPLKGKSHGALVFEVGGQELRISPAPMTKPSEHTVLGFAVDDHQAVMAELSARGVLFERFEHLPQDERATLLTTEGARVAWFRDPDGNLLSIVQYAAVTGYGP